MCAWHREAVSVIGEWDISRFHLSARTIEDQTPMPQSCVKGETSLCFLFIGQNMQHLSLRLSLCREQLAQEGCRLFRYRWNLHFARYIVRNLPNNLVKSRFDADHPNVVLSRLVESNNEILGILANRFSAACTPVTRPMSLGTTSLVLERNIPLRRSLKPAQ